MTPHAADDARTDRTDDGAVMRRDEWLLDEAIMETFPASDPVAAYQHASDEPKTHPAQATQPAGARCVSSAGTARGSPTRE